MIWFESNTKQKNEHIKIDDIQPSQINLAQQRFEFSSWQALVRFQAT